MPPGPLRRDSLRPLRTARRGADLSGSNRSTKGKPTVFKSQWTYGKRRSSRILRVEEPDPRGLIRLGKYDPQG